MKKKLALLSLVFINLINFSSADDIFDSIQDFSSSVWNFFSVLIQKLSDFFGAILNVVSYIFAILKAIWFWLVSLLSWVWDLIVEVFNWDVFVRVNSAFNQLWEYIWGPAVVFLSTLLFLIIFRIWVAFVFKILNRNIEYHTLQKNTQHWNVEDDKARSSYKK